MIDCLGDFTFRSHKNNQLISGKLIINLKLSMKQWFYHTYWNIAVLVTIIRHWMLSVSGMNQAWHVCYKNVLMASLYLQSLCKLLNGKPHPLPCMISWFIICSQVKGISLAITEIRTLEGVSLGQHKMRNRCVICP